MIAEHNHVLEGVRWEVWEITPDGDEWEWYAETNDLASARHYAAMLERRVADHQGQPRDGSGRCGHCAAR